MWVNVVGWIMVGGGLLGWLLAEDVLVQAAYPAFGEFRDRWWLALALCAIIIGLAGLTAALSIRAIAAFRSGAGVRRFLPLSAFGLAAGALEFVVAIALAVASLLLLQGDVFSVIPTVHLH
jgi:hypothetical protein